MNNFQDFLNTTSENVVAFLTHLKSGACTMPPLILFENPAYVVNLAQFFVLNQPNIAKQILTHAFDMDPIFGAFPLYFRALSYIKMGEDRFISEGERTSFNNRMHALAKNDLRRAIYLTNEFLFYISGISTTFHSNPESPIAQQYNDLIALLTQFTQACRKALSMIEACDTNSAYKTFVVKFEHFSSIEEAYVVAIRRQIEEKKKKNEEEKKKKTSSSDPQANDQLKMEEPRVVIPVYEIESLRDCGLKHYYELGYAKPKPPWYTSLLVAMVGAFQVLVGALISGVAANFAWEFIQKYS